MLPAATAQPVEVRLAGAGGEYMDSAVVVEWKATAGERVTAGETLLVVETAKAATEVEAPASGVLQSILAKPGDEVAIGALLALIAPEGVAAAPANGKAAPDAPAVATLPAATGLARRWPAVFASPLAKRLAQELGVALEGLQSSGPHGRILRADVMAAAGARPAGPAPAAALPVCAEGYRRAMAQHMAQAAAIPCFTVAMDCDGAALLAARQRAKAAGGRASVNDFLLAAVARSLKRHLRLNARWHADGVEVRADINLGVAIATTQGLVVPVIRNADRLDAETLARQVAELRARAESMTLTSAELVEGSFTVSNLGPFGVDAFVPALNPPQAAILAVPAFRRVAVFDGARLEARPIARLAVTADHRVLDGADVARFLADLREEIGGL